MKIGTKSLLFGAHAFWLHPFFVAWGWIKLYGWPWHPAIWLSFVVHDWGYWGKPNMDGPEGEEHPILGAKIVKSIFGPKWGEFCLLHSRFFATKLGRNYSKLCVADKMAIVLTPSWLYLPMVKATGELHEYMGLNREAKYTQMGFDHSTARNWYISVQRYIYEWIIVHKSADGPDRWLGNASEITEIKDAQLPGYLEGGFENDRYIVRKAIGSTDPDAKYLIFRYDGRRDPHTVFAGLMYSISVERENPELASGIREALRKANDLTENEFKERYRCILTTMRLALENEAY